MSFEHDVFDDCLVDELVVTQVASLDSYGKPTFASQSKRLKARVVYETKLVRATNGDDIASDATAWVPGGTTIRTTDEVEFPDGEVRVLVGVERYPDGDGEHHRKLLFVRQRAG